jgi:hypothetical protein
MPLFSFKRLIEKRFFQGKGRTLPLQKTPFIKANKRDLTKGLFRTILYSMRKITITRNGISITFSFTKEDIMSLVYHTTGCQISKEDLEKVFQLLAKHLANCGCDKCFKAGLDIVLRYLKLKG